MIKSGEADKLETSRDGYVDIIDPKKGMLRLDLKEWM